MHEPIIKLKLTCNNLVLLCSVDQLITRTTGTTNANFPTTNNSGKGKVFIFIFSEINTV